MLFIKLWIFPSIPLFLSIFMVLDFVVFVLHIDSDICVIFLL